MLAIGIMVSRLDNVGMRRFFGGVVGVGGVFLLAYGAVKFFTGSSFGDEVAIAQNINVSVAQCLTFGFIALVVGGILTFA
jgi:hypothetical protein